MYTNDRGTQILISVLKAYNIKKVVASPGTTNMYFIGSIQNDPFFEIYSAPDERSAAYIACGLSSETGEGVVISCTGATASRNYLPGLTEAYYRKLPIISVTGTEGDYLIGHLQPQVLDRSTPPTDAVKFSVNISRITDEKSEWLTMININRAISEAFRHGGGPVNISLQQGSAPFKTSIISPVNIVKRINYTFENAPQLPQGKIAIFCSSHSRFTKEEENAIEMFCRSNNSVVFCDHTSSYKGQYRIDSELLAAQKYKRDDLFHPELLIHIGEISGGYYTQNKLKPNCVWRVSEDGEMRDRFKTLGYVFEMREIDFFNHYAINVGSTNDYYISCKSVLDDIYQKIPELPFGNIWVAQQLNSKMPLNSTIHFGILNSLRSWNFFVIDKSITTSCNVGGFGIDGPLSTLLGASIANEDKLYYCILGDLAFFYDINSLGNRHVGSNIRILLINNGHGTEFSNFDHPASKFGDSVDNYIAAAGHYGKKSTTLVKHYVEDLGFDYISASCKDEFYNNIDVFTSSSQTEKPLVFEIFTEASNESDALKLIRSISDVGDFTLRKVKHIISKIVR